MSEAEQPALDALTRNLKDETEKLLRVVDQAEKQLNGKSVSAKEKVLSMHKPKVCVIAKGKI